jgi:predicted nucleic acid-binding protein
MRYYYEAFCRVRSFASISFRRCGVAKIARVDANTERLDTAIAGQAIRHGMILVTANLPEFDRVPALRRENWAMPGSG